MRSQQQTPSLTADKHQRGFTLLEIIVVVAIIGIMVVVIGVSMSRDTNRLAKLESQRFHVIVNEVRDESILAGESYFLEIDEDAGTYRFEPILNRSGGQANSLLKPRVVEKGVVLRWDVFEDFDSSDDDVDTPPRALISPLGEITPFTVEFMGDEVTYEVFINDENQLDRRDKNTVLF